MSHINDMPREPWPWSARLVLIAFALTIAYGPFLKVQEWIA